MRRVLATLVVLSLVMSMFTGVFAPMPEARAAGPAPIVLGTAGNFAILAKTAVTTTGVTHVTGDIGISPALASDTAGFALIADSTNTFSTSSLVTGKIYAADYAPPTPANMTAAVLNMEAAYTDATGRAAGVGPNLNLGAGTVAGQTLVAGTYTWGTNVTITTDLTLSGSANDVWLFQITGTLDMATDTKVILSGGALAKNIFWQVSDAVTLFPGSHFEGNILGQTNIAIQTGATLNGRALAQSAVTLQANTVLVPTSAVTVTGLVLTSPNGGESWVPGISHAVTWTVTGDTSAIHHFTLYYTVDSSNSWELITNTTASTDRTYSWTVPSRISSHAKVIIYAMNAASEMQAYDASDAFFTMAPTGTVIPAVTVIHPVSGDILTAGATYPISWLTTGTLPASFHHFSVYYSMEDGRNGSWLHAGYSATSPLSWVVPAGGSTHAKIVVYAMDAASQLLSDATAAVFVVTPSTGAYDIAVTAPTSGASLTVGNTASVTWTTTGTVPTGVIYKVWYSVDGGLSWEAASSSAVTPFSWMVPARLSLACSVKVVALVGTIVQGTATSATFAISNPEP